MDVRRMLCLVLIASLAIQPFTALAADPPFGEREIMTLSVHGPYGYQPAPSCEPLACPPLEFAEQPYGGGGDGDAGGLSTGTWVLIVVVVLAVALSSGGGDDGGGSGY